MGFFKEFKSDLSQAVNELLPEEAFDDNQVVNTLENKSYDADSETVADEEFIDTYEDEDENENVDMDILDAILTQDENIEEEVNSESLLKVEETSNKTATSYSTATNNKTVASNRTTSKSDEVTIISKGTIITGSISSNDSLEVMGTINGDIDCQGKLTVSGDVTGNCMASEVYVSAKRLEGCINSEGSVKIGLGTVVIGNVTATSAVIAGAVKGEVDVNGPIIIDSSAVIKGNIKTQSIQINNGAVIEGFCSFSYASLDIDNIFE